MAKKAASTTGAKTQTQVQNSLLLQKSTTVLNSATAALEKAAAEVLDNIAKSTQRLAEITAEIEEAELLHEAKITELNNEANLKQTTLSEEYKQKLASLQEMYQRNTTEIQEKLRIARLDLDLAIKENAKAAMYNLASEHSMVVISIADNMATTTELTELKTDLNSKIAAEVAKATNAMKSNHTSELRQQELQFEAETAKLVAENESLKFKCEAAQQETLRMQKQLDDLRNAMVEMTKAQSNSAVNVYNDSKK